MEDDPSCNSEDHLSSTNLKEIEVTAGSSGTLALNKSSISEVNASAVRDWKKLKLMPDSSSTKKMAGSVKGIKSKASQEAICYKCLRNNKQFYSIARNTPYLQARHKDRHHQAEDSTSIVFYSKNHKKVAHLLINISSISSRNAEIPKIDSSCTAQPNSTLQSVTETSTAGPSVSVGIISNSDSKLDESASNTEPLTVSSVPTTIASISNASVQASSNAFSKSPASNNEIQTCIRLENASPLECPETIHLKLDRALKLLEELKKV